MHLVYNLRIVTSSILRAFMRLTGMPLSGNSQVMKKVYDEPLALYHESRLTRMTDGQTDRQHCCRPTAIALQ